MRPTLSASRLILFTLAVVMLVSLAEGNSLVAGSCFSDYSKNGINTEVAPTWAKNIISCSEQNQHRCLPGYEIKTSKKTFFLRPNTEWLTKKINEGTLQCPPMVSKQN